MLRSPSDHDLIAANGPVYVGGLDRSGKTTMSGFLTSHSRIAIPGVGSNMWTYFYRRFGDLSDPDNFERCLAAMTSYKHVRYLEPDSTRIRTEFRTGPPTYARLFSLFLIHFAERSGKPRWGAQTGMIERYAEEVIDAYDGVRIVHMLRDPRDRYLASIEAWPGGRLRAGGAVARWHYSTRLAERCAARHPESYLVVRFEDLIERTESTLRLVCDFLGEEFEPAMLSMDGAPTLRARLADEVDGSNVVALSPAHVGRYRERLSREDRAFIGFVVGRMMERHGYVRERIRMSTRERTRFLMLHVPDQVARLVVWRAVEAVQQWFPRLVPRRPGRRMIVGES